MSTTELQRYEVHATKVQKKQYIFISDFKTNVLPILGGFSKGKESTSFPRVIRNPELWNTHDG